MKKFLILSLLILTVIIAECQNSGLTLISSYFKYTYDSVGNRIKRELFVIYLSPHAPNNHNNNDSTGKYIVNNNSDIKKEQNLNNAGSVIKDEGNNKYESFLGKSKINIYPNPTTGEVQIDITNFSPQSKGAITVTDYQGRLIKEINQINSSNLVDISNTASGSYILKLVIDGMSEDWVIVKE